MNNLGDNEICFSHLRKKNYELRYHRDAKNGIGRENDTFSCNVPSWIDAVNLWIDDCNCRGYKNYYLDYVSEDL